MNWRCIGDVLEIYWRYDVDNYEDSMRIACELYVNPPNKI